MDVHSLLTPDNKVPAYWDKQTLYGLFWAATG